jgi:hypothetical protein
MARWSLISVKVSTMSEFNYMAPAELFAAHGRAGVRYRRFAHSADAIRYAVEKLPAAALSTTAIEVDEQRYDGAQIQALYHSARYPLARP